MAMEPLVPIDLHAGRLHLRFEECKAKVQYFNEIASKVQDFPIETPTNPGEVGQGHVHKG